MIRKILQGTIGIGLAIFFVFALIGIDIVGLLIPNNEKPTKIISQCAKIECFDKKSNKYWSWHSKILVKGNKLIAFYLPDNRRYVLPPNDPEFFDEDDVLNVSIRNSLSFEITRVWDCKF